MLLSRALEGFVRVRDPLTFVVLIRMTNKPKLLVIAGPTSSGKSELAVKLAKKYNGEIISADSRQIYKGMDLGTGKIPGKWTRVFLHGRVKTLYLYKDISHHCIDFVNPKRRYSAALFQKQAQKAIADILRRGKLPILCGGTAHWIDAVVYNQQIPDVKPNLKLRAGLEKKSAADLYQQLKKLDPRRAKTIDRFNKRRLIRALEIVVTTGKPVPPLGVILTPALSRGKELKKGNSSSLGTLGLRMTPYDVCWIGINPSQQTLYKKIDKRLKQRLKAGLVKEVARLQRRGLSWKRLESFGLEYKFVSLYLQKKLAYQEMVSQLSVAIKHYSKRQMTWWKRNKEIKWISHADAKLLRNFRWLFS